MGFSFVKGGRDAGSVQNEETFPPFLFMGTPRDAGPLDKRPRAL